MTQIRRYNSTGEHFACDPNAMTMSEMLHHSELDRPLEDYQLDNDMSTEDLDNSTVVRAALAEVR